MRLFYIIIFLIFSAHAACYASQVNKGDTPKKNLKISFISSKKQSKFLSDFGQDSESLQKDFLPGISFKTICSAFLLFALLFYCFSKITNSDSKAEIKRLKLNYCYLFRQFYLKHIFW